MKTPAPFDLNAAIQVWRQKLAESPSFRVENLDEIEAHLRDSVRNIEANGLSAEEVLKWTPSVRPFSVEIKL